MLLVSPNFPRYKQRTVTQVVDHYFRVATDLSTQIINHTQCPIQFASFTVAVHR